MTKNKNLTNFPFHVNIQTRWRDLDAFGHVNNAVFATYIETAREHYLRDGHVLMELNINCCFYDH